MHRNIASAGFNLRDCTSNSKTFRRAISKPPTDEFSEKTSVLGVLWDREKDTLSIKFDFEEIPKIPTKRIILAFFSSFYDPLGLISPCILPYKLLVQDYWKNKFDWDTHLPPDFVARWLKLFVEAKEIPILKIPRRLWTFPEEEKVSLHIFCDASKSAYACVAYLTYVNSTTCQSTSTLTYLLFIIH